MYFSCIRGEEGDLHVLLLRHLQMDESHSQIHGLQLYILQIQQKSLSVETYCTVA